MVIATFHWRDGQIFWRSVSCMGAMKVKVAQNAAGRCRLHPSPAAATIIRINGKMKIHHAINAVVCAGGVFDWAWRWRLWG